MRLFLWFEFCLYIERFRYLYQRKQPVRWSEYFFLTVNRDALQSAKAKASMDCKFPLIEMVSKEKGEFIKAPLAIRCTFAGMISLSLL